MATEAEQLAIQNLQSLAQSIRGAGDIKFQAGQQQLGFQQQQLLQQQARQRQLSDFQAQRTFATGEREATQKFRTEAAETQREFVAEESELERQTRETIAAARRPPVTDINISIDSAAQKTLENATGSGFLKADEDTGKRVISGRSDEQAKFAETEIIDLEGTADEDFNNPRWRAAHNSKIRDAISVSKKSGQRGAVQLLQSMFISATANKDEVIRRVTNFRKSLINREVESRLAKEDFTKVISSSGLAGVKFREATSEEQAIQRARVEPRIRQEVEKQFSGITVE